MRNVRAALGCSVLPLAGCSHWQESSAGSKDRRDWRGFVANLKDEVPMIMQEARLPGLSMVLIRNGKLFWRRGFGVTDAESKEPVDNETVFQAGSMSKPVFAYAVMKLCERRAIDLDTPLTRYTSERFLEGDPRLELITARHVLSHTSGFPNWRSAKNPLRINFNPGEQFRYSGEGYFYLQSVVTHLTGKVDLGDCATYEADLNVCATDIEDYLKANLLVPFAMGLSGYTWNDRIAKRLARGHGRDGTPFDKKPPRAPSVARYGSAGALLTTPTDYAKFLIEVIDPKPSDRFRLNKDSLKEMLGPHVKATETTSWALGWAVYHSEKGDFIGHGGDNKGFHSFAVASAADKSGYVIMTNGDSGTEVLKKVMEKTNEFLA